MCSDPVIDKSTHQQQWWNVPHVVSAARPDQDKNGDVCTTFDALFNPETIEKCQKNPMFQEMCVNISFESIQKHHKGSGDSLSKDWKLMKNMKCKGERPGFQLIPDKDAKLNKDLRKESSVQKQIREMKEQQSKDGKYKKEGEEAEELMIEELDSKEFAEEIEKGLVQPK